MKELNHEHLGVLKVISWCGRVWMVLLWKGSLVQGQGGTIDCWSPRQWQPASWIRYLLNWRRWAFTWSVMPGCCLKVRSSQSLQELQVLAKRSCKRALSYDPGLSVPAGSRQPSLAQRMRSLIPKNAETVSEAPMAKKSSSFGMWSGRPRANILLPSISPSSKCTEDWRPSGRLM